MERQHAPMVCRVQRGAGRALRRAALAVGVLAVLGAPQVHAELLRCETQDGNVIFTDDPSLCPGAEPFEPSGTVHGVKPVTPAAPGRQSRIEAMERQRLADQAEAGEAARWKRKRLEKEEEIRQVQMRRDDLLRLLTWCNRGGRVVTYDDAGIKKAARCSDIRRELKALDQQEASARLYLDETLPEECRRAGCLPGWLR
jgi:hypothetical protein